MFTLNRTWKIFFVAVILYLLTRQILDEAISDFLVRPFLARIDSSVGNDILILLITTLIAVHAVSRWRKRYVYDRNFQLLILTAVLFYLLHRFVVEPWNFTPFHLLPSLKYFDALVGSMAVFLTLSLLQGRNKSIEEIRPTFIEDNAIENAEFDAFGYSTYAMEVAQRINNSVFSRAFSVGIIGAWGSGKTSLMNLIRENLNSENQVIIEFNPWASANENGIITDFFATLSAKLSAHHSSIDDTLSRYTLDLSDRTSNAFFRALAFFVKRQSVKDQYDQINRILARMDKQIVVLMDDLDRLDEFEVMEVMKLIRNTANFRNTVFIVAYDRNYLVQAARRQNIHNAEFALEKIFQIEVSLPLYERKIIRDKIIELLGLSLDPRWVKDLREAANDVSFAHNASTVSDFIVTMRDVTRFCNSFSVNFSLLKDEVVFHDFFLLEILRFKFPAVHEMLHKRYDDIFQAQEGIASRYNVVLKQDKVIELLADPDLENTVPKKHRKKIIALLKRLFPGTYLHSGDGHLSIANVKSFSKYFANRLFAGDLSEKDFAHHRNLPSIEFNRYIDKTIGMGLGLELQDRFKAIRQDQFTSREDFEKIITGIFHLARSARGENIGFTNLIEYPGEDLYDKCYDEDGRISKKFYNGDQAQLRAFLLSNFQGAQYPFHFESEMIQELTNRGFLAGFPLSTEDLENLNLKYLKDYLNSSSGFNFGVWWHFRSCHLKSWTQTGQEFRSHYYLITGVKEAILGFAKNVDLKGFLETIIESDLYNKNKVSIRVDVLEIFGDWEQLRQFVESTPTSEFTTEFLQLLDQLKTKNYSEKMEFDFTHLNPK